MDLKFFLLPLQRVSDRFQKISAVFFQNVRMVPVPVPAADERGRRIEGFGGIAVRFGITMDRQYEKRFRPPVFQDQRRTETAFADRVAERGKCLPKRRWFRQGIRMDALLFLFKPIQ